MRPQNLDKLLLPIKNLNGVGPKLENLLSKIGINSNIHILWHLPYSIIQRQYYDKILDAEINTLVTTKIKVLKHEPSRFKRQPYRVKCINGETIVDIVFFNARHPVIKNALPIGKYKIVSGKLEYYKNHFQFTHPSHINDLSDIELIKNKEPIYGLTAGLNQKTLFKIREQVIKNLPNLSEWIDKKYLIKYNFQSWKNSITRIHNPKNENEVDEKNNFRKRLAFDELLSHQLSISLIRNFNFKKKSISFVNKNIFYKKIINKLNFKLTTSQVKVINEINKDLESDFQMIRLLQGDVGSGKTIVALIAMLKVVESGFQSALMVPTSILAFQHYETFCSLLENFKINIQILTGKDKGLSRLKKLKLISSGEAQIIIGTHSLIQEDVAFKKIGLTVIDEQHRFGVYQRMAFNYKGLKPSILVMSATPIPRTLTLAAYGDMNESKINEKPLNRKEIVTSTLSIKNEKKLIITIKNKIENSKSKIYWVCPLIQESEELDLKAAKDRFLNLNKIFKNKVLLMHGQLNEKEKEDIMKKFKNEDYRILVSTTVIEVGIDIKSATNIIIEHAERFGLAQMHQLRGRVGRNNLDSFCVLLHKENINENAKKRLKILKETNDGFKIAEEDLKIRGPGEILGSKQSGLPSFKIADLSIDKEILEDIRVYVKEILSLNPNLIKEDGKNLKSLLYLHEKDVAIKTLNAG